MKLIVGLGNPGREYEKTRHNVGFCLIDIVSDFLHIPLDSNKMNGIYGTGFYNGEKIMLLKPQKYMNLSGEVVSSFVQYFKIDVQDILIISDDLDLKVGCYRFRPHGSSGGHNGLKNISLHLGTNEYKRLKIGISNDKQLDTKDYVLGKFSKEDTEKFQSVFEKAPVLITDYLTKDFDEIMSLHNRK
ncbi:MAG: aminoacyl-tRNA hydrolase [Bacilli bacterium]|nr:aminoacyl-tRNA hydrolase [Bacilli bacterium]